MDLTKDIQFKKISLDIQYSENSGLSQKLFPSKQEIKLYTYCHKKFQQQPTDICHPKREFFDEASASSPVTREISLGQNI